MDHRSDLAGLPHDPPHSRPHQAFDEAVPIAKARGLIQLAMGGPAQAKPLAGKWVY